MKKSSFFSKTCSGGEWCCSLTVISYIAVPLVAILGTVAMILAVQRGDGTIIDQFAKSSGTISVIGGAGIVGTLLSVWLYYNFCNWLNVLNCTLPPVGIILVISYFMNKKDYEKPSENLEVVNWFAVIGVIAGAVVANVVSWGIASINGMAVAAVLYVVGQVFRKNEAGNECTEQ